MIFTTLSNKASQRYLVTLTRANRLRIILFEVMYCNIECIFYVLSIGSSLFGSFDTVFIELNYLKILEEHKTFAGYIEKTVIFS